MGPVLPAKKMVRLIGDEHYILRKNIDDALLRAENDMQGGFPNRNGEPLGVMSSDISDTTATLALYGRDDILHRKLSMERNLKEALKFLRAATTDMFSLKGLSHEEAQRLVEEQSRRASNCLVCDRVVAGTPEDPLPKGRCKSCYNYLQNHGFDREIKPERGSKKQYETVKRGAAR